MGPLDLTNPGRTVSDAAGFPVSYLIFVYNPGDGYRLWMTISDDWINDEIDLRVWGPDDLARARAVPGQRVVVSDAPRFPGDCRIGWEPTDRIVRSSSGE